MPYICPSLQKGILCTTVSNTFEAPHHNTMEVLASEQSISASARAFLGVLDCSIEAAQEVEETWASRTVTYTLTPTKSRLSPFVPHGLPETITVNVSAQLPSSVVTTFQLKQGRWLRLEAHVMPEKYSTSRLTISAYHNNAAWAATGLFVRCAAVTLRRWSTVRMISIGMLFLSQVFKNNILPLLQGHAGAVSQGLKNRAEKRPVKHITEFRPFYRDTSSERLLPAFTKLRVEFDRLGYGVPAEIAAAPYRVDM